MAVLCFVLGQSGTGKSRSLKNFKSDELAYINVSGKPLPFKGKFSETIVSHDYREIERFIKNCSAKSIAIDDSTFLMSFQKWDKAFEKNFEKWTELGKNFTDLLRTCAFNVSNDKIVYFLHHIDSSDDGRTMAKCLGKMINQDATLEAFFTIVLSTAVIDGKYYFLTQNNGKDTTKSPEDMFPTYAIDNDLVYVDDKIRNYYELGDYKSDAEMNAADQAVSSNLEKPDSKGRRPRGRRAEPAVPVKEELPFEETPTTADAPAVSATLVPEVVPEADKPAKRTRKERTVKPAGQSEQSVSAEFTEPPELVQDGTTNTDFYATQLKEDAYFYDIENDNYLCKHAGEVVDIIVGGKTVMRQITKEEFGEGVKRLAQTPAEPLTGMNPPEQHTRGQRRRRVRT